MGALRAVIANARLLAAACALAVAGCAGPLGGSGHGAINGSASGPSSTDAQVWTRAPMRLQLLGTATLSRAADGPRRDLGGISGLDYDPASDTWFLLSDDRSERAPARFYLARIALDERGIGAVDVTGVVALERSGGASGMPDPEAIRLDPVDGQLVWSSEGDPRHGGDPFVQVSARDGAFVATWPLPANLRFDPSGRRGARPNLTLEGLAFSRDGRSLWMSMEAPLRQDGEPPTLSAGAWTRFSRVARDGRVLGQFAYPLEPIRSPAEGGQGRADNGVSELLTTPADTLLVVERSGRETAGGSFRFSARIFEATAERATDVRQIDALADQPVRARTTPMRKRLVLDLMTLGLPHLDNIEGAAWGPRLPNGHRTLMLVSDDNFSPDQVTQLIALEVVAE